MKRYLLWALTVYILLLLLPLPLLGATQSDKGTEEAPSSSGAASSASSGGTVSANEAFRILNTDTNAVVEVSPRDFLIGTVAAEMYPSYHAEALKAQAVASFTYYTVQRNRQHDSPDASLKGADFSDKNSGLPIYYTDDQLKERWGKNYDAYYKKISEAVDAVLGKWIAYDNQPIVAVYHAISSGMTEDAGIMWGTSYPYLVPVASPGDKLSPAYQTTVTVKPDELSSKIKAADSSLTLSGDPSAWLGSIQTSPSGTVTQIELGGNQLTGSKLREALGLKSACFSVNYEDDCFHFTVLGYGHDVGMSQYGADYLARQGSNYEEILKYYYTGVSIADSGSA